MSVYVTQTALTDRYGEAALIQLTGGAGAIDATVLAARIADATALIDTYLAARYAPPMEPPVPAVLTYVAAVLVWSDLHTEHRPDDVAAARQEVLATLAAIRDGRMDLPLPAAAGGASAPAVLTTEPPARLFGGDSMRPF